MPWEYLALEIICGAVVVFWLIEITLILTFVLATIYRRFRNAV